MFPSLSTTLLPQSKNSYKHIHLTNKTLEPSASVPTKRIPQLNLTYSEKLHLLEPNAKLVGSTFDATHLDKFLKTHFSDYQKDFFLKKQAAADQKNQTLLTNKSKESCIFKSKPRFDPVPESFRDFFSKINEMALTPNTSIHLETGASSIEEKYSVVKTQRPKNEIMIENSNNQPISASSKLNDMKTLSKKRQEYSLWKKELADLTKKQRVMRNGFRSGAMNIDNPLKENSYYYKDASSERKQELETLEKNREKHKMMIFTTSKTNPRIEFFNSNNENEKKKSVFSPENKRNIDDWWVSKKKNPIFLDRLQNSKDRVFGKKEINDRSLERALYLKDQETRNKDYNIVSLNHYDVEVQPREFREFKEPRTKAFYFKS